MRAPIKIDVNIFGIVDPNACYLDSEDSILCAACALESLHDMVPRFRPVAVAEPSPGETCDQCSATLRDEDVTDE